MDKVLLLQPSTSDLYFKKRKNQIILGPSTSDVSGAKDINQAENIKSGESKSLMFASSNNNMTVAKDRPHKGNMLYKMLAPDTFNQVVAI